MWALWLVTVAQRQSTQGSTSTPSVEIAPGVFYPFIQLGACTDCETKQVCCGTNLSASLPVWSEAQGKEGIVAIDTQLRYNDTELVANELAKINRSRDQIWITTKIDPKVYCSSSDPKAKAISMMAENLRQLNMSHVDLALLHEPCVKDKPHPADQLAWEALIYAVEKGWARAIGVDKFSVSQIEALNGTRPAVVMAPMGLLKHDDATIQYCQRNGIQYNAYGVLHGCMFADKTVLALASKYNKSASQICGAWTRQRGCTMAIGAGTDPSKMAYYIAEDLDIFSFNMTDSEIGSLNELGSEARA